MPGLSWKVEVDDADMRRQLSKLLSRMENKSGFYKNVGEHLINKLGERFKAERAPDGSPWQRLAPATIAARLQKNGNAPLTILRVTGRLAGSFNYEAGDDQVRIGSAAVQAALQHFGGQAGRNNKVNVPARPILGLEPNDPQAILDIAQDWLGE